MPSPARRAAHLAVALPLAVLYALGVAAAVVVIVGVTCASAVRLGWTDTRRRATHGAA